MAIGEIYIKLNVTFANDPKVRALARYGVDGILARDLYVQMICHCKEMLTDGLVQEEQLGLMVYPLDVEHGKQLAKQLASVGLITEEASGYRVLAYLKRNGSRADVEALSEKRAEAGRRGGEVSRKPARQDANQAKGKQVASRALKQNEARDRVIDRVSSTELPYGSSVADEPRPDVNPGPIVAAYIEGAEGAGLKRPASSLCARVGKQARQLLNDGYSEETLVASARTMGASEWNDLAVQVRKDDAAANGTGPRHARSGPAPLPPTVSPRDEHRYRK